MIIRTKLGALAAAAVMAVPLIAVSVSADRWGDYGYRMLEDGTVEIVCYDRYP